VLRPDDHGLLAVRQVRSRRVDPLVQRVVKFWPNNPPRRGDIVLVDGERCRVTRAKVSWVGREWTLHKLKVKPA